MTDQNTSRRRFLAATGSVAGAAALAGCSGGGSTETETEAETETSEGEGDTPTATEGGDTESSGGTFNRINSTISTFDPIEATDTASGRVIRQVFDTLLIYENATTTVTNQLATDYEVSDDFNTYTFTLADDATFHNGDEVTASDIVYSWERLAQSSNSSRAYFILDSIGVTSETETVMQDGEETEQYKPGSLGVEAVDDKTLRMELSAPFHATLQMMAYTSFAAVPEGIVGDIEGYDGDIARDEFATSNPVGAGPFELENYESGTQVAVTAVDDHYRGGANVDRVHWQVIEKDQPSYNYAMNRNADLFTIPTPFYEPSKVSVEEEDAAGRMLGSYGEVRNGDTVNYVGIPTINSFYVGFNMEKVPKPVRKAFAYVANQELFINEVFKGRGSASYHFTPPSIYPGGANEYTNHAENNYPYGYGEALQDKAIEVMEEAGYGPDNRFEIQWTQYQSESWLQMAQILRDRLSSAYIDMKIEQAPFGPLLSRGRNGKLEVYTLGWIADWPAPDNFLQLLNPPQTDTSSSSPVSYINWNSEEAETSAAQQAADAYSRVRENQAPTESAQQERNEAYVQIEEANWEDVGFLPIYHQIAEYFWYDTLGEFTPPGGMDLSRLQFDSISLDK